MTVVLLSARTFSKAEYDAAVESLELEIEPELAGSELAAYLVETVRRAVSEWDPSHPVGGTIEHDELEALGRADRVGTPPH